METRALLSAMWRSRTGPLLVAAQVAITLAVVVNVAYIIQQRLANMDRPTGLDVPNIFWLTSHSFGEDYNHVPTVQADLEYLNRLPGVVAAAATSNIPQGFGSTVLAFAATQEELDKGSGTPSTVFFGSAKYLDSLGLKLRGGPRLRCGSREAPRRFVSSDDGQLDFRSPGHEEPDGQAVAGWRCAGQDTCMWDWSTSRPPSSASSNTCSISRYPAARAICTRPR